MGVKSCQCPERLVDFLGQQVVVGTVCTNEITGTLEEVTNDYIELSGIINEFGPVVIQFYRKIKDDK